MPTPCRGSKGPRGVNSRPLGTRGAPARRDPMAANSRTQGCEGSEAGVGCRQKPRCLALPAKRGGSSSVSWRITVAPDICVVVAKKDNTIEYWAVATVREKAVAAVEKELPPGWTVTLTRRRLTSPRATRLKMRPIACRNCEAALVGWWPTFVSANSPSETANGALRGGALRISRPTRQISKNA